MHPMLNTAVKAARQAGRIITRASDDLERVQVARKAQNDFVTEVDRASEQAIVEILLQAYPHHCVMGEEFGISAGPKAQTPADPQQAEALWIIDPLDGTTNFIHGLPHYAVSIGLMEKGVMTQALVYDPNRNELFTATKGAGAYLNDRRIRVSKRTKLDEALIGTGFPYRKLDDLPRYLRMLHGITEKTAAVRRPGAAALDLAYVASARYDGFFELGLSPWDVAAGALLVTEAGGLIGDFTGEPRHIFGDEVVAANPKVFGALLPLLVR
jgi:myo-inositol-1(or 4)-monophosphatase